VRLHRALATTATALALGLAAGAPAAHADPVDQDGDVVPCTFSQAKLSPSTVTLGLSKVVTIKVTATASAGCADDTDGASIGSNRDAADGDIKPVPGNPTQWVGSFEMNPNALSNADARTGAVYVDLGAVGGDDSFPLGDAELEVLRATRLDADAPSKVKKNKNFKVEGFLEKASWDEGDHQYVSVDDWFVRIDSKPKGGKWSELKTIMSGTGRQGGVLDFSTKIKKETCFRFVYRGELDHIAPVTSDAGCVKIK
jgi:hypothetical protein